MGILDLFRLDGKVSLVTGGGQGIGRAFALALAEAGADVVIANRTEKTGKHVAAEIAERGKRALFVQTDVSQEAEVKAMVTAAVAHFGRLDIAVNNAFGGDDWDSTIAMTLKSVYLCCKAEGEIMKKQQRGKIVNISSLAGSVQANGGEEGAYNIAKAGVNMLTRCLAADWGRYNINVNCISPSYTLSPARRCDLPESTRAFYRSYHPLGWYERPEDLCGTLIYLVSDASNYVTGRDIMVDGGHSLNIWMEPLERIAPPLISPEEEVPSLKHDLEVLGEQYEE